MDQLSLGLYGKVPAHGDFIDRQLPTGFIRSWDEWLQGGIANSRERLGESWLNLYLTTPIWRFMLSPGALDDQCWAGVLVPSVDSVGRYFPLTLATCLPSQTGLVMFCQQNESWFEALESAALGALQEGLNADQLCEQLKLAPTPVTSSHAHLNSSNVAVQSGDLAAALAAQLDAQVARSYDSYSVWFSIYTEPPMQNLLLAQGLPTADQYTAMIDNQWQQWGWGVAGDSAGDSVILPL